MAVSIVEFSTIGNQSVGVEKPQIVDATGLVNNQSITIGGVVSTAFKNYMIEVVTDTACSIAFGPSTTPPTNASPAISLQVGNPRQLGVKPGYVAIAF